MDYHWDTFWAVTYVTFEGVGFTEYGLTYVWAVVDVVVIVWLDWTGIGWIEYGMVEGGVYWFVTWVEEVWIGCTPFCIREGCVEPTVVDFRMVGVTLIGATDNWLIDCACWVGLDVDTVLYCWEISVAGI